MLLNLFTFGTADGSPLPSNGHNAQLQPCKYYYCFCLYASRVNGFQDCNYGHDI